MIILSYKAEAVRASNRNKLQEVLSYHILGDRWVWGSLGCSLMVYSQFLAVNMSTLSLSAFTVERYIAICHPMKAQVST